MMQERLRFMLVVLALVLSLVILPLVLSPKAANADGSQTQACMQFTKDGIANGAAICHTDAAYFNIAYNNVTGPTVGSFTFNGSPVGAPSIAPPWALSLVVKHNPATATIIYANWNNVTNSDVVFPVGPSNDFECVANGGIKWITWFASDGKTIVGFNDAPAGSNDCHFTLTLTTLPSPVGGQIIPIDMTSLFIAGAMTNSFWMVPTFGGIAGAVITLFKVKRKHAQTFQVTKKGK